jgi:ATP-binding cassette subfamily E protein 1
MQTINRYTEMLEGDSVPASKRIAVIDRELCNPRITGYACQKACPVNRSGQECITLSQEDSKPLIDESLCIGCGICVKRCQRQAIMVVNLPEELRESPMHRYGRNMFALYRLPVPKQHAVVGLIGPNGTGKSTVLNILSGSLKPNTGLPGEDVPWHEIIERFRGTELQAYMEQLSRKGTSSAYKPQHVDLIPRQWSGRAGELLRKSDEREALEDVVKGLNIGEMLEKKVSELSGGELQLLAIAATLLRGCDFYFFDEPSSYLDAQQRLVAAREIRSLCGRAVVMVIEHDLAVADYLADYTHILYGRPGAFGIVSRPYGVRLGINTYLEGYIKEENVRFRPEPITFSQRAKPPEKDRLFLSFPGFGKSFPGFSLRTEPGNLYRGEVIGILGPNSTGKTTFIRMLAGLLKPDSGRPLEDVRLSYKPQRLVLGKGEEGMTVQDYLSRAGKPSTTENKRLVRFLGLDKLMERQLGSLSGGELQSCFVAAALMREHGLLLLDEPSAFLDVEQRLRVARLIREHAEGRETPCFVVDHDLQFLDVISDRVMVFSGQRGVEGHAEPPCPLAEGMNSFLMSLGITFRRDPQTGRPRANKPGSQKDREQRESGNFYYAG